MVYWKFSTLCADVCHAASFMQMSKKIAIIHGKIQETTGMAIPSISRMFQKL
jgi:hypothetical protein